MPPCFIRCHGTCGTCESGQLRQNSRQYPSYLLAALSAISARSQLPLKDKWALLTLLPSVPRKTAQVILEEKVTAENKLDGPQEGSIQEAHTRRPYSGRPGIAGHRTVTCRKATRRRVIRRRVMRSRALHRRVTRRRPMRRRARLIYIDQVGLRKTLFRFSAI